MSYTVQTPCWSCDKNSQKGGSCKDGIKLQDGVNAMYQTPGEHLGSGSILMSCSKVEQTKSRDEQINAIFAEEMKESAEDLTKVCDGTAEVTTAEASEAGEMAGLMKVYKRINTEVFKK